MALMVGAQDGKYKHKQYHHVERFHFTNTHIQTLIHTPYLDTSEPVNQTDSSPHTRPPNTRNGCFSKHSNHSHTQPSNAHQHPLPQTQTQEEHHKCHPFSPPPSLIHAPSLHSGKSSIQRSLIIVPINHHFECVFLYVCVCVCVCVSFTGWWNEHFLSHFSSTVTNHFRLNRQRRSLMPIICEPLLLPPCVCAGT